MYIVGFHSVFCEFYCTSALNVHTSRPGVSIFGNYESVGFNQTSYCFTVNGDCQAMIDSLIDFNVMANDMTS